MNQAMIEAEYHYALFIGLRDYPDVVAMAQEEYGIDSEECRQCIAEVSHFHLQGRLPRWAHIIEDVIHVEGNLVFVHADTLRFS